jgi:hypothetical protein
VGKSPLSPIPVPFCDDSIKVVAVSWSDSAGANIEVISTRSGRACTVTFEHVAGLRTLSELDLASMWMNAEKSTLSASWLFSIEAGGWFELEATRHDFYTQHQPTRPREFLVAGFQECVSILSLAEPSIHEHPPAKA